MHLNTWEKNIFACPSNEVSHHGHIKHITCIIKSPPFFYTKISSIQTQLNFQHFLYC